MKNSIKLITLMLSIFLAFTSNNNYAQKSKFKGIVTYDIKYTGKDITPAQEAQLPKEQVIKIYENKTMQETKYGPVTITEVTNGDEGSKTSMFDLMAVMQKKVYVKTTKKEIEQKIAESKSKPVIKYIEETKEVAGYKAKKAIFSFKEEDAEDSTHVTIWYSEELGGEDLNYGGEFSGLKGFPLEYEMPTSKITIKASAKTIVKGKVKETEFLIPTDYNQITQEELQGMMGGGGGDE
ncbi:MAG: hypothetical protein WCL51_00185 [Bacteroidota bacterium]